MIISAFADFRRLGTFVPGLFCAESGPGGDGVPSSFCKGLNIEEDRGNILKSRRNTIQRLSKKSRKSSCEVDFSSLNLIQWK